MCSGGFPGPGTRGPGVGSSGSGGRGWQLSATQTTSSSEASAALAAPGPASRIAQARTAPTTVSLNRATTQFYGTASDLSRNERVLLRLSRLYGALSRGDDVRRVDPGRCQQRLGGATARPAGDGEPGQARAGAGLG